MARIAVVGSVAVDRVLRLAAKLCPGGHAEARDAGWRLGGGGTNVAVPLVRAGHSVALLASVGDDPEAAWLLGRLREAGVDVGHVARVPGGSTKSLILLDPDGERTVVNLSRCLEPTLAQRLGGLEAEFVYVRSRAAGLASALASLGARATVVAHVPPCGDGERPARILVGSASDLPARFLEAPFAAGRRVAGGSLQWAIVTQGANGAQAYSSEGSVTTPAEPLTAVDTTGAGDAFAAGLLHALAQGATMERALRVATDWGTASAGGDGSSLGGETVDRLLRTAGVDGPSDLAHT